MDLLLCPAVTMIVHNVVMRVTITRVFWPGQCDFKFRFLLSSFPRFARYLRVCVVPSMGSYPRDASPRTVAGHLLCPVSKMSAV